MEQETEKIYIQGKPACGDAGEKWREKPLEELLEDDVMVFQPGLCLDCVEPGGEKLLPCEASRIHIHLCTVACSVSKEIFSAQDV